MVGWEECMRMLSGLKMLQQWHVSHKLCFSFSSLSYKSCFCKGLVYKCMLRTILIHITRFPKYYETVKISRSSHIHSHV
uniref:Uncharacterized protein n=1 Tax=Physcomitrium patens TaxID=3218 RepID=A0A2K1K6A6_PHYPA|nr:hypothetical protein PHYPA_011204 [Physcomitrium patens]